MADPWADEAAAGADPEKLRDPAEGEEHQSIDAARAALNRMRQAAQARGEQRQRQPRQSTGRLPERRRRRPSEPFGRDPQELGGVVSRMISERGWSSPVAVGSVIARWETLIGPDIAAHCQPESFTGTELQVRCDSTTWATQLRLLSSALLQRLETELGPGVVTSLRVYGPAAPNWRKGGRRVGGRGPRDTYG